MAKTSFSADVKKELIRHYTKTSHCRVAELAAEVLFEGKLQKNGSLLLELAEENTFKKYAAVLRKEFGIQPETDADAQFLSVCRQEELERLGGIPLLAEKDPGEAGQKLLERLTKKPCCKRAFLRSAFTACGTISDPEKHYHLEFVCRTELQAAFLKELAGAFGINAKTSVRRSRFIVYLKEGPEIADLLNIMEAHVALMNFENIRIVREMRGNVNRQVNCETANIEKTVTASMKQIEDINYIKENLGLSELDESLRQIAEVRLAHPDIPLSKLGGLLQPPIGKSGVNHRLRKISKLAEELRAEKGE